MPFSRIVILTGAGISAESGLITFRDNDGLWCNHRIEDVATPEAFARNPSLVHTFYNQRRAQLHDVKPNSAHLAIARLAEHYKASIFLITQNVDDLHERAMQNKEAGNGYELLHIHGELKKARCTVTDHVFDWHIDMDEGTLCPCCQKPANLRPHIVWFGEMPFHMDLIYHVLEKCDLFISIGTSGNVYPAAGFVQHVRQVGRAHTVELNLEPSHGHSLFEEKIYGKATEIVPQYIDRLFKSIEQH